MRDAGGFSLPPLVPSEPESHRRAVELLGAATQRRNMSESVRGELVSLVGAFPPSRTIAQQWKGALRLRAARAAREAHAAAGAHVVSCPAVQATKMMGRIVLPSDNRTVSYTFVLLEVLRFRYDAGDEPKPMLLQMVQERLGFAPSSAVEAMQATKALKRLQRMRKSAERRPPRIPDVDEDLRLVNMLLGQCAHAKEVGPVRTPVLMRLIGGVPRDRNVAASWKKKVEYVIRRRARKRKVAENLVVANRKRAARRAKREARTLGLSVDDNAETVKALTSGGTNANQNTAAAAIGHIS